MLRRRELMADRCELPSGYQRCNYIESTGTKTINTGLTPVYGDEINVIAYRTSTANNMFYASGALTVTSSPDELYCRYFTSTNKDATVINLANFPAEMHLTSTLRFYQFFQPFLIFQFR